MGVGQAENAQALGARALFELEVGQRVVAQLQHLQVGETSQLGRNHFYLIIAQVLN